MSGAETDPKTTLRAVRKRQWWIASMVLVLFLFCAPNILIPLLVIPQYDHIYRDVLPGQPLPALTQWILSIRQPLMIAGAVWPLLGLLLVWRLKLASMLWLNFPFILSFTQILLTLYALFQPMLGVITSGSVGAHQ